MEVNETKARLFPDKENAEGPCLREQVEKISQRIERITEERHEREVTKLRDRKLRLGAGCWVLGFFFFSSSFF